MVLREVRQADSERAARAALEREGHHVFEIKRRGFKLALPAFARSNRKILGDDEFLIFNQELAGLLKAGLPLLQALDLLLERQRNPRFAEVLGEIRDQVKSGEELSAAFASFGTAFSSLYSSTLMAGERSGDLEQVLRRFIRYLRLVIGVRKRITGALIYPAVLLGLSVSMIAVMIVVVIPRFEVFYQGMDLELPLPTRVLLAIAAFFQERGVFVVVGLAVASWFFRRWSQTEAGRVHVDRALLKIPIVGGIRHRFALSEFCRSLSTLLQGGLPLVPSMEVSTGAVSNAYLRRRLQPAVQEVRQGKALHGALEGSGVMTDLAIDMVKVGEATGALDEMLSNVSDFLDDEIETRIQRLLSLIEPLMLVMMGFIVSLLLVAMYMPMFSALGQIQ
jgi:type IV pilus assembly protein PilC